VRASVRPVTLCVVTGLELEPLLQFVPEISKRMLQQFVPEISAILYINSRSCPCVCSCVCPTRQFCILIHRQNRPLHFLWQNWLCRWIKMKGEKRSPNMRSLFFNAADMQLASQLRLLTRLSSPSGNSPTLRVLRITQRMTWPSHAPAVLSVLQGKAGQGAGQGPSVRLFVLQGRG
jgi:hypothetical protein